jgi:thioredoxin reductase
MPVSNGASHDLLIIGAGPAGVACALQAKRDGLSFLLVGDEPVGGLLRAARCLKNYPGALGESGENLSKRMVHELDSQGIEVRSGRVTDLVRTPAGFRAVMVSGGVLQGRTVCLASGTRPRKWEVPAEGISEEGIIQRDARSLPRGLNRKSIIVVGGGEASLDTALSARDRGGEVIVLCRSSPRAPPGLVEETRAAGISIECNSRMERARWKGEAWELVLGAQAGQSRREADFLVVCIGREPRLELLPEEHRTDGEGGGPKMQSPGLFLAGDVCRARHRYVGMAISDGIQAAIAAGEHLANGSPASHG